MNAEQLKEALTQLVENYRRCGLSRLPRTSEQGLSPELLRGLGQLQQPTAATAQPASEAALPTMAEPAATAANQPPASAPGVGQSWTLPVLDVEQRASRFQTLSGEAAACRKCPQIVDFRQQTVFGSGSLTPTVCFVGEAPGADEDRQGVPFVGKAGQLLTKIIGAMKMERDAVYILNALKCRPPQNRTPVPEEIESCRHFLEHQLETLQPEYIVCLGAVAARAVLQSNAPVGRLRGKFHAYKGAQAIVTYHPSYLLRNADAKRLVWDDMKMLMQRLGISV